LGGAPSAQRGQAANDKERFRAENIAWLNSAPSCSESLRGKVLLIDFWT
jgi:hypothetical protein